MFLPKEVSKEYDRLVEELQEVNPKDLFLDAGNPSSKENVEKATARLKEKAEVLLSHFKNILEQQ